MHPGDIRLVTAVKPNDDSPYHLHRDLIVLPMRGYQPLADKMGGGTPLGSTRKFVDVDQFSLFLIRRLGRGHVFRILE